MCTGAEKIQDAELEVMRVLWKAGRPAALADIRHALADRCGWEDSTVKTLLRRLCEKGAVALESRGMYRAVITQAEYSRWVRPPSGGQGVRRERQKAGGLPAV